jgi:hypothetical protein
MALNYCGICLKTFAPGEIFQNIKFILNFWDKNLHIPEPLLPRHFILIHHQLLSKLTFNLLILIIL